MRSVFFFCPGLHGPWKATVLFLLIWFLLAEFATTPSHAEIFQWTDSSGQVHYGDTPVSGAKKLDLTHGNVIANSHAKLSGPEKAVTFPYRLMNGTMVVEGKVNGVPINFVVDTGASYVVIPSTVADKAGVDASKARAVQMLTANGTRMAPLVFLDQIEVGGLKRSNIKATVQNLNVSGEVGLLGMEFLRHYEMRIDHDQQTVTLVPKK